MEREEGGDESAAPFRSGHADEHHEQQGGVQGVEQDVDQMQLARPEHEELDIEHVGEPGQGVPVGRRLRRAERLCHPLPGKASLHQPVIGDVQVIVVKDELVTANP